MPRPVRLIATSLMLVIGFAVTACSDGSYRDTSNGQAQAPTSLGWASVKPIAAHLPTSDPVMGSPAVPEDSKPLLVNIWASWCEPCKKELPLLQQVNDQGQLNVIGFSRDGRKSNAAEELMKAGVTYPNWMDTAATLIDNLDGRVPYASVPATLLIRDGAVIAIHLGEFKTEADVLKALELT